jgi:hypothetical protein
VDKHAKTQASYRIDAHIGSHLRMRRIEMGMTQEKLAEAFGLTSNGGQPAAACRDILGGCHSFSKA